MDKSNLSLNKPAKLRSVGLFAPAAASSFGPSVNQRFGHRRYFDRILPDAVSGSKKVKTYEEALESLARELAGVKEHEREKIAEQLHDEFGQDLVLVKIKLGQLLERLPPQYGACVEEIDAIISDLIRHTRTVINELSSQQLYETGLRAALQSLMEEIQTKHGLICTARLELMPKVLKDEVQQILFQAVRELLFNVVKHAQASRAKISMTCSSNFVVIEVSDDGRGFDRHKTALSELSIGRFGLFSVRARLASLRGDLRIFSRVGNGTRAIITLPIDAA